MKIKQFSGLESYCPNSNKIYIQCKGFHSGRPLKEPIANCFELTAESPKEADHFYWLFFALWKGRLFHPYLKGSVIPFITKGDLIKVFELARAASEHKPEKARKMLNALATAEKQEAIINQKQKLLQDLKITIAYELIK